MPISIITHAPILLNSTFVPASSQRSPRILSFSPRSAKKLTNSEAQENPSLKNPVPLSCLFSHYFEIELNIGHISTMAARTGRLFQDPNLNAHISGVGTASGKADLIGKKKGRAGGRKPLGDLSNTGKPINQASRKSVLGGSLNLGKPSVIKSSKQLKSQDLNAVMNDEAVSAKAKKLESNRTTANKSRTGSRKALSDISNSVKANIHETKNKNSLKPSSLSEEPFDLDAIAEEGFLHNHQECIKSQSGAMDLLHFLKTVGLENDSDDDMTIDFELPAIRNMKSESSHLELEEVDEPMLEVPLFARPNSPERLDSPRLSSCYTMWDDDYAVNLKLIDSPERL